MIKIKKAKAFTLAEVLTTLMVIGVVAALTIPSLMNNYKDKQTVTQLKKSYAELSNAAKMMTISEDCSQGDFSCLGWNEETPIEEKVQAFAKQFKGGTLSEATEQEKDYYGSEQKITTGDGAVYYFYEAVMGDTPYTEIYVDTNGPKSPNKFGYDVFVFMMPTTTQYSGKIIPSGSFEEDMILKLTVDKEVIEEEGLSGYDEYTSEKERCFEDPEWWCTAYVLSTGKMDYKKELNK